MKTYTVQANDTPMTIAHRFTGNRERYGELIAANQQKGLAIPPRGLAGPPTFDNLYIGEKINLPHSWGLGAVPTPTPPTSPPQQPSAPALPMPQPPRWVQITEPGVAQALEIPSWTGYFCGEEDNQAGVQLYRYPPGSPGTVMTPGLSVAASVGPSINYPNSPIARSLWYWSGLTYVQDAASLPLIPGLPCVTPQWLNTTPVSPSDSSGAVLAPGGGFNRTTPRGPLGPQHTM